MSKIKVLAQVFLVCVVFCGLQLTVFSNSLTTENQVLKTNISNINFIIPCSNTDKNQCCNEPSIFNACDELKNHKIRFFEQRCEIYKQLNLTQEQRIKAKTIDEKFFDDIAPLKLCYNQEKTKLKDMQCKKNCRNDIKCQKEQM